MLIRIEMPCSICVLSILIFLGFLELKAVVGGCVLRILIFLGFLELASGKKVVEEE